MEVLKFFMAEFELDAKFCILFHEFIVSGLHEYPCFLFFSPPDAMLTKVTKSFEISSVKCDGAFVNNF